jgi:hypothetical protein
MQKVREISKKTCFLILTVRWQKIKREKYRGKKSGRR